MIKKPKKEPKQVIRTIINGIKRLRKPKERKDTPSKKNRNN